MQSAGVLQRRPGKPRTNIQSLPAHAPRARALWCYALLLSGSFLLACRKPQADGPRRQRPADASVEFDAGAPEPTSCDEVTCTAPATCEEVGGKAGCICPAGYTGDPHDCQDVDECTAAGGNDCDDNATCRNTVGGYDCTCNEGYSGDGKHCAQASGCESASGPCHIDADCTDNGCACREGYEGDGHLCRDVDECSTGTANCAEHARCVNLRGHYDCVCDTLHEGDGREQCTDLCDVAQGDPSRCDPNGHGRCQLDSSAAASCQSCDPAYLGDGKKCTFDAECSELGCGDNTVCGGSAGARKCECAPGFSGDPMAGCVDIDECETGAADCDERTSTCLNVPGGYVCDCRSGFARVDGQCTNVDECALGLDLCDQSASCTDRDPGYTCDCKPGYEGDGFACADIDECAKGTDSCSDDGLTTCQNTAGSYECVCPNGYAGNGRDEACYCDLSGYWGMRQNEKVELPERAVGDVVIIAGSTQYATVWELDRFRYDGEHVAIERKACGSDVAAEVYSPLYEEVYSSAIPNSVYDTFDFQSGSSLSLSKQDALPGKPFVTPREATLYGLKMDDPLNDPWPKSFMDIKPEDWVDTDMDGEPGVTLWPGQTTHATQMGPAGTTYSYLPVALQEGTTVIDSRAGCVSTAVRAIGYTQGHIDSCGRITGKVINEKTEGRVHSCSVLRMADWDGYDVTCSADDWSKARHCTDAQVQFLDEQDQTVDVSADFELVKLGGLDAEDIDCAAVRRELPAISR